jgi:hypothetical protein
MKEDSSQIVHSLKESVILPNSREAIPTYQVMDLQGNILNEAENPKVRFLFMIRSPSDSPINKQFH